MILCAGEKTRGAAWVVDSRPPPSSRGQHGCDRGDEKNELLLSTRTVLTHFLSAMRACRIDSAMSSRLLFARLCEPSFALQTCDGEELPGKRRASKIDEPPHRVAQRTVLASVLLHSLTAPVCGERRCTWGGVYARPQPRDRAARLSARGVESPACIGKWQLSGERGDRIPLRYTEAAAVRW